MSGKTYIIGSAEELQILFPDLDWEHQRLNLDGTQAVIGVDPMTQGQIDDYESDNPPHLVFDHSSVLAYLNADDKIGIWREEEPTIDPIAPPSDPDPDAGGEGV